MKVFISVDMEGATGIVHRDQLSPEGRAFEDGRRLLTGDVNAAIEGAARAGAVEFLVNDGHGIMRDIRIEDLDERAEVLLGPAVHKPLCQTEGVDETFDCAMFVGYHSRAGWPDGTLAHTWVGARIHEVRINGTTVGETGINAAVCGAVGVPVVMVAGGDDTAACADDNLSDCGEVEYAVIKRALGRQGAICRPPAATARIIADAAEAGARRRSDIRPYTVDTPALVEVEFHRRQWADRGEVVPGIERRGERCLGAQADDLREAVRTIWKAVEYTLKEDSSFLK